MSTDHRVLGRQLELFDTVPIIGAGLPMWLPAGAIVRRELEQFAAEQATISGCSRVYTPVLAKRELFERSGHWDKFSEDMFPPMDVGGEQLVLRPANCPSHIQVYANRGRSWRELPVRLAEAGTMFRSEPSGNLGGLSRVRQINLDDAHVFCRESQVIDEVILAIAAIRNCYEILGVEIDHFRLSVRGPSGQYAGNDDVWQAAEQELHAALMAAGVPFQRAEGEAAFYGPKIDVQVIDAHGREETLSTVQVDRVLPERFGLSYTSEDGTKHRPVMVHRGLLSSMERMIALLIERYDGRFPTWLSPVQIDVLPVAEIHIDAALARIATLEIAGIRARLLDRGTLGSRIRQSHEDRTAYTAVIGQTETNNDTITINKRELPMDEVLNSLKNEIASRSLDRSL